MVNDSIKIIRDSAIAIVVTIALFFLGFIPVVGIVFIICCGFPLAVIASKYDLKIAFPVFLLTALAYFFLSAGWTDTVTAMTIFVLPGVVCGRMFREKREFYSVLLATCAVICIGHILNFVLLDKVYGIKIDQLILQYVAEMENAAKGIVEQAVEAGSDFGDVDIVAEIGQMFRATGIMLVTYLPSIVAVIAIFAGYILVRVCEFAIKRTTDVQPDIVPFSMMKVPRSMCWITMILYVVYVFMADSSSGFWIVITNVVFVLYTIIALSGLSCVDYWFSKVVKIPPLRMVIYVIGFFMLSLFMSFVINILVIIAVLDSSRNFRQIGIEDEG